MRNVNELFGSQVFHDAAMQAYLPRKTYHALRQTIDEGAVLSSDNADIIANAMKNWAIAKGATHYCHWFQPMTGITAEKHDSFISPVAGTNIIMEFSGKELIKGESDASSFPSGGLRATFEARGYTAWDPTSYTFVKDDTLYIPTAFCSYSGEALDKKTPLLRSIEALQRQAIRILRLFGHTKIKKVFPTVGAEQEYFLISAEHFAKRKDLMLCGRTLVGAAPPKGQELGDHYYGSIKPEVFSFMQELETELWSLGIPAKTKHNEVAPGQHELACVFNMANLAADQNQLIMECMKKIAKKHGLVCLLHEKPFEGINGSGKHNNWSIATDTGINLLDPGHSPQDNAQFLLFLSAIIKAVDEHQDLLRISIASASNDHRLGGHEAPPAIVSIFVGDELFEILHALETQTKYTGTYPNTIQIGVSTLPDIPKDTTDRNRTSPFAFTGNKFEFRMPGASCSISGPNFVLNTIMADSLQQFADYLEKADDFGVALNNLIQQTITQHKRILFNGNSYSEAWVQEAEVRGLFNLQNTVDALPYFLFNKNLDLFTRHAVLTEEEIHSRYNITLDAYCKTIHIEAMTIITMTKREILPAAISYTKELAEGAQTKESLLGFTSLLVETELIKQISAISHQLFEEVTILDALFRNQPKEEDILRQAIFYQTQILPQMQKLRHAADQLEELVAENYWPFPSYTDILYYL